MKGCAHFLTNAGLWENRLTCGAAPQTAGSETERTDGFGGVRAVNTLEKRTGERLEFTAHVTAFGSRLIDAKSLTYHLPTIQLSNVRIFNRRLPAIDQTWVDRKDWASELKLGDLIRFYATVGENDSWLKNITLIKRVKQKTSMLG